MRADHFTHYDSFQEALTGFTALCRDYELKVGLNHIQEAIKLCESGFAQDQSTFQFALKSLYCTCEEEYEAFDYCFRTFWNKKKHKYNHTVNKSKTNTNAPKTNKASLVMAGFSPKGKQENPKDEASNVSGASRIEALKKTDFTHVSKMDSELLDEIAEQLLRQLNHKLKRKMHVSRTGPIDLRKTIRKNMSNGEDLINLIKKNRKKDKFRIILLLDVSGSMDKYSFFLLKFIWSLKSHLKNIEAFVFSTNLIRITEFIHQDQIENAMSDLSAHASNWSGGTKIGECLKAFNDQYAKRILNGKSITIVLSDGLDDGNPGLMRIELEKIKMRTNKMVWLNPLKGTRDYEPIAQGMQAVLPLIDTFQSAHNLESLLELENILAHA